MPLTATVFDGTQAEPLNPLAVVRRTVLFTSAGDGNAGCMCFRSSVWRGVVVEISSVGQANMVNKNVKALPAPDTKTAWVRAPVPPFGFGRRSIWVACDGTRTATYDHCQPRSFFRLARKGWCPGEPRRMVEEHFILTVSSFVSSWCIGLLGRKVWDSLWHLGCCCHAPCSPLSNWRRFFSE